MNKCFKQAIEFILIGIFLFCSLFITGCDNTPTDAGPLWTKYWTIVYESKQTLTQIQFVGPDEAWIVGYLNLIHYKNGNFYTVHIPPSIYSLPGYVFTRASFCDPDHGWLIGEGTLSGVGSSAVIYKYNNGMWEEITPLENPNPPLPFYLDIKALSPSSVWVVGDYIWHFDGSTWIPTAQAVDLPKRLYFNNENDGYLTFEDGATGGGVLHWDGNSWSLIFSSGDMQPRAIAFDNQGNGFMVMWEHGYSYGIYHVWSWEPVDSSYYFTRFTDIASNSAGDIWAVGQSTLSTPCSVLAHWDGVSWHYERTIPPSEFYSLFVKENGDVWSTVHTGETGSIAFLNIH